MVLNSESQRHGSVSTNVCTAFICTVERETIDSHRVGRGPRFYPDCPIFHLASAAAAFFDTLFLFPAFLKPRLSPESQCVPRDLFGRPPFGLCFLAWLFLPPPPFLAGLFFPPPPSWRGSSPPPPPSLGRALLAPPPLLPLLPRRGAFAGCGRPPLLPRRGALAGCGRPLPLHAHLGPAPGARRVLVPGRALLLLLAHLDVLAPGRALLLQAHLGPVATVALVAALPVARAAAAAPRCRPSAPRRRPAGRRSSRRAPCSPC
jgi:hypothetical protein